MTFFDFSVIMRNDIQDTKVSRKMVCTRQKEWLKMFESTPPTLDPWATLTVGSLVKISGRIEGRAKTKHTLYAAQKFSLAAENAFMSVLSGDAPTSTDLLCLVTLGDRLSTAVENQDDEAALMIVNAIVPAGDPILAMGR